MLRQDRLWAAYALGDLAPGFWEHSEWYASGNRSALVLVLRKFDTPIVLPTGDPRYFPALLDEIDLGAGFFYAVRTECYPAIRERYAVEMTETMWRMSLDGEDFRFTRSTPVRRLGPEDLPAVQALFAERDATGDAATFFAPEMLGTGVYYGAHEHGDLIATAGTHMLEPCEGVGAIGNVYTRRDRRGRGLATNVTGAVAADLTAMGLETVVLNVNCGNAAAMRVYERLGFRKYCAYEEGIAINSA